MSRHQIILSPVIIALLNSQGEDGARMQREQKLPGYAQFVDDLFKAMPTLADEVHHAGTGIASEAGEILDITKKGWIYEKPFDDAIVEHLLEELGDLRYYYQA